MEEVKRLFENYIQPILIDQDGISFILESDFDNLSLSISLKKELLLYLERLNIGIITNSFSSDKKNIIDEELLDENSFSKYTKVEYDNDGKIINLDFSDLNNYLENKFLPSNIKIVRIKDNDNVMRYYEAVKLSKIINHGFNETEIDHIFKYLEENRIIIRGFEPKYEKIYNNYYLIRNSKKNLSKTVYSEEYQDELIREYKLENNIHIRNKIVLANLRLVESISYKYASIFDVDTCEINSYGYEGLIMAIETYNPNLGYKFSTYAMTYIINKILSAIPTFFNMKKGTFFENFLKAKRIVEAEENDELKNNLDLVDKILNYMVQNKYISIKHYNDYRDKILMTLPSCLDNLEIEEFEIEENNLERIEYKLFYESLDKLFNILSQEEIFILSLSYGLNGCVSLSVGEIEDKYGIDNVFNKKRSILRKLRTSLITKRIDLTIPSEYNLNCYEENIKKY